ncbi:MAG: DnaA regulatory inactivator Hda [Burkholderiaceae bacterium]
MSAQLALDLIQPLEPSLDNFVPGANAEVLAALRAVANGTGPSFVYLWGTSGSGRSHLLRALNATSGGLTAEVPEFAPDRSVFVVDDVDRLNDESQRRLFVLANEVRAMPGATLLAAGPVPPAQLILREDLRTRLAWGLVYQLHPLSDTDKAHALDHHAASRGIALSPEVVSYLLTHVPRDMRTLVAILDALDAHALVKQRAITVPLVREWLARGDT